MNALKTFYPTRYASLNFGNNTAATDGITFDVAAQIGALFKSDDHGKGHDHGNGHDHGRGKVRGKGNNADSLTRGLHVKHVFEAGFSQDGGSTITQADVFNALERMPGGGRSTTATSPAGPVVRATSTSASRRRVRCRPTTLATRCSRVTSR